ncbi:MAG: cellobiose phosphorylase, partial [Lachnospiraceae bacterium]|nr:cellobiose phosphorylase [Lachnospiraceae bacterium]
MYTFLDNQGTFRLEQPENVSYLYFPIAGEQGLKGAVTPTLGGDLKRGQNAFVLQTVSADDLHNNKATRNFWCYLGENACFSATGVSAKAQADKFTDKQDKSVLTAGPMWHLMERESREYGLSAKILSFVPVSDCCVELMHVEIRNNGEREVCFTPTAAVPMYGRSADNLRDHRHVTSLLHRAVTDEKGVYVTPTLSFDERGHQKNHITYYVCGMEEDGAAPVGFLPVVEDYIGEGGSFEMPKSVLGNLPYDAYGRQYDGYEIIGALRFAQAKLQPGEKRSYTIFICAEEKKAVIDEMLQKYADEICVLSA